MTSASVEEIPHLWWINIFNVLAVSDYINLYKLHKLYKYHLDYINFVFHDLFDASTNAVHWASMMSSFSKNPRNISVFWNIPCFHEKNIFMVSILTRWSAWCYEQMTTAWKILTAAPLNLTIIQYISKELKHPPNLLIGRLWTHHTVVF